jgi:hypothetical protein
MIARPSFVAGMSRWQSIGVGNFDRRIAAHQKLDGHENQIGPADVFDSMNEVFARPVFEVPRLTRIMVHVLDPAVFIVASGDTSGHRRPEIIQNMSVERKKAAWAKLEVPHAAALSFGNQEIPNSSVETIHVKFAAQVLRPTASRVIGRPGGRLQDDSMFHTQVIACQLVLVD